MMHFYRKLSLPFSQKLFRDIKNNESELFDYIEFYEHQRIQYMVNMFVLALFRISTDYKTILNCLSYVL